MAKNNPNAAKIGHFAITKTPEMSAESEPIHGKNIVDINTKKYQFYINLMQGIHMKKQFCNPTMAL